MRLIVGPGEEGSDSEEPTGRGRECGAPLHASVGWCLVELVFALRALLDEAGRRGAVGSGSEPRWGCKAGQEAQLLSTRPSEKAGQHWAA